MTGTGGQYHRNIQQYASASSYPWQVALQQSLLPFDLITQN